MTSSINDMWGRDAYRKNERERWEWLSVCLYLTVNYLVKVTNLMNASLTLSLSFFCFFPVSLEVFLPLHPLYLLINGAPRCIVSNLLNCVNCSPVPRRTLFSIKLSAGSLINQRHWTIQWRYRPHGSHMTCVVHDPAWARLRDWLLSSKRSYFNLFYFTALKYNQINYNSSMW